MKKNRIRAADLMAQLEKDPDYQRRRQELDAARLKRLDELRQLEAPVIADLRDAGFEVESIHHLAARGTIDLRALPLLVKHLQQPHPPEARKAIAEVLAVPEAKVAWSTLLALFERDFDRKPNGVKWAIGWALAQASDDQVIGDVIELFADPRHGENRLPLILALKRSRLPQARAALDRARNDPDLGPEIRRLVGRPRKSTTTE